MSGSSCARLSVLTDEELDADGRYVLYWMQHSQRAVGNPALEHAAEWSNRLDLPLYVLFVIVPDYPDANARHFAFMLEGLANAAGSLKRRNIHFAVRIGDPCEIVATCAKNAAVVVFDRAYLRPLVAWREELAQSIGRRVEMVEGDVIVPVAAASDKQETGARTIRPKIHRVIDQYLDAPDTVTVKRKARGLGDDDDLNVDDTAAMLDRIGCRDTVGPVDTLKGGYSAARARLNHFTKTSLQDYAEGRSDILHRNVSMLSPYLHFGHISPLEVYHAVRDADASGDNAKAFIEEMVVRRELAANFVHYNRAYDSWEAIPKWARETLSEHRKDTRDAIYSRDELAYGKTDDPYWNAAMREMRLTGYLHNHMRMYWGKRVLGWMEDPADAHRTLIDLNNTYLLDGRDANTYANIAWIFGVHDRGWPQREVYGKVRTMKPSGLKRKFDIEAYVRWAENL